MSTEIHAGPISATRFWGGKDRGVCIQITGRWKSADYGAGLFVQGEYADVVECAKAIVAFDAAEHPAVDGVPAGEATTASAPAGTPEGFYSCGIHGERYGPHGCCPDATWNRLPAAPPAVEAMETDVQTVEHLTAPADDFYKSFDARLWARAWLDIIAKNPSIPTDEGTMIGWFANALMRGYDEYHWTHPDAARSPETGDDYEGH